MNPSDPFETIYKILTIEKLVTNHLMMILKSFEQIWKH